MDTKETIKNNFGRFAAYYDNYSAVQDYAGSKLAFVLDGRQFEKILDIGCGTGNFTKLLQEKFPHSIIKAIDISGQMIRVAGRKLDDKNVAFITADAETVSLDESFELIASNACFQWLSNLETALCKYSELLGKDGVILFSMFGPVTFCELNKSLNLLYQTDTRISSCYFVGADRIRELLKKYFNDVSVQEQIFKQRYASLWELLNTIKYTGTRGLGINGKRLSKSQITTLEEIYKEQFGGIVATYQILYCRAQKR